MTISCLEHPELDDKIKKEKNKMTTTKITSRISTIMFISVLVISTFFAAVLITHAQDRIIKEYDTYAYIIATPNPIGVNQQAYVQFRIDKVSPTVRGEEGGDHFTGFTVDLSLIHI